MALEYKFSHIDGGRIARQDGAASKSEILIFCMEVGAENEFYFLGIILNGNVKIDELTLFPSKKFCSCCGVIFLKFNGNNN